MPEHDGGDSTWAWLYLGLLIAAFAAYLAGLGLLSRAGGIARRNAVVALACALQLLPLAGPVLLSTDVYTYWDYARISTEHGGNPYVDVPSDYPDDVAYPLMGSYWYDTSSVYGPGFTLASEAHALAVGESAEAASWTYRVLAAAAMVALVLLAARLSTRPAFAAAFVGWNPLLAVHFAGGGHNDAWMMAFVLAALAFAAAGRTALAGVSWALAIAIKWVPLLFLPLRLLEARRTGRRIDHRGLALGLGVVVAIATWRYGLSWLGAVGPLASNLAEDRARYAIPIRVASIGLPEAGVAAAFAVAFLAAYAWLLREAWRGRARLALTTGLLLVCTSWLVPWYAVWAVPLAAVEEDRTARVLALALSAYLLRDAVPL
ncbi:MAG TPA: glycosyltransferase 87 family protein [Gaiellaceae bacterium]|nr:glycosyltransferase 87 family protein [Gaiellaceae bacterium]